MPEIRSKHGLPSRFKGRSSDSQGILTHEKPVVGDGLTTQPQKIEVGAIFTIGNEVGKTKGHRYDPIAPHVHSHQHKAPALSTPLILREEQIGSS